MKLSVFDIQKNHFALEIEQDASIQDFKNQFRQLFNQDIDNCKLICNGREMKDNLKLSNYSIIEGSKIMILKLKKQEESKIYDKPNFPQPISSSQINPQISSEVSSLSEIPKTSNTDIKPLERLYRDLNNSINENEEMKFRDMNENTTDEKLFQLKMMGFNDELAKQALIQTNGNYEDAVAIILTQIEDFTYKIENANAFVNELMKDPKFNYTVWQIATNTDQYDQFIAQKFVDNPDIKAIFFVNKELLIEACKKKVIFKNKNRRNIEGIPYQLSQGQDQGKINAMRSSLNSSGSVWNSIELEGQRGIGKNGMGERIIYGETDKILKNNYGTQEQDKDSSSGSDLSELSDSDSIEE